MAKRKVRKSRQAASARTAAIPSGHWYAFLARPENLALAAIVLAGIWAYSTSFAGVFVFDDLRAIVENPHIRDLWPLTRSMSAPRDVTVSGRPVACLTLALNYAMAPPDARDVMQPGGPAALPDASSHFYRNIWDYHALNLTVHLLAGLTLFGIVRRTLLTRKLRERFGGVSALLAFLVALLWLVHPLQTQSVTYIVQRVESLMGLFYLLTLYCAIRAAGAGPRRRWWVTGSIAACALGMGSKETMVTAPLVVWLWDFVFEGEGGQDRRKTLYAGLAATWIILAVLVASDPRPNSAGFGLGGWTWWAYLKTQAEVVVHYLKLAVVPLPLIFDYGRQQARTLSQVAPQALFLAALVILTLAALSRKWPVGFLGAWFFVILAPTSSILPIPTEVIAEHRMYLPVAAVISLAVLGTYSLIRQLPARRQSAVFSARRLTFAAGLLAAAGVATMFGSLTYARNMDYWSNETLLADTVLKRPLNARMRIGFGAELLAQQRFAEAEVQLRAAVGLDAGSLEIAQAHMYLGSALCAQNKVGEGIPHLEQALALDPTLSEAHGFLGEAYAGQGQLALAVEHFMRALEGLPDNPFLLNRVGWIYATSARDDIRNGAKAVELAERAVQLTAGQDAFSFDTLAAAYAEQDRFIDAVTSARKALALARAQNRQSLIPELEQHLALYEAHRKVRE